MTNEELKKKIVNIALTELQVQFGCGDTVEVGDREACAESIADALIAAGLTFEPIIIRTVELPDECEKKIHDILKEEEAIIEEVTHRAEVAEKMFDILHEESSMYMKVFSKEWYKQQAEKELAEEEGEND